MSQSWQTLSLCRASGFVFLNGGVDSLLYRQQDQSPVLLARSTSRVSYIAGAQPRAVSTPWAAIISPSRAIVQTSPGVVSNLRALRPHRLAPPSHETATPRWCCPQRSPQLFNVTKHGTGKAATQLCEAQQFQTHRTPKTKDIINVY